MFSHTPAEKELVTKTEGFLSIRCKELDVRFPHLRKVFHKIKNCAATLTEIKLLIC